MIIIWGTRMYGETDVVPGLFSVQTKFSHVNFLPCSPIQSYLVFQEQTSLRGRAVEIPMSKKSITAARTRCLSWIFVVVMLFVLPVLGLVLLACGVLSLVMKSYDSNHHASHERAVELCSALGPALGPAGVAALRRLVDLNFQQRFETVAQDDNDGNEEGGGLGEGEVSEDLEFAEFLPSDGDGAAPDDKRKTDGGEQLPTAKILEAVLEVV
ncbi:hypothetical protein THAOC_12542 [Thalassiosira oceanica]|uniref:Uncharacterized protein n=1 Tax=Thalassiosira oceanica TaxID=159749 RepID=K0SMD9_THAOC|nr:hypothetical protein THAOC_12542 [Thalassiosira oceanica]|eukprot:EJK66535.1 hypothetical protein THAOC_12542 [Thalassiosira oceanica]